MTSLWIFILEKEENSAGAGSNGHRHESAGPDPYLNVTHPQHWNTEMPYLQQRERRPHHCPRWWSVSSDRKTQEPVIITNIYIQLMSLKIITKAMSTSSPKIFITETIIDNYNKSTAINIATNNYKQSVVNITTKNMYRYNQSNVNKTTTNVYKSNVDITTNVYKSNVNIIATNIITKAISTTSPDTFITKAMSSTSPQIFLT